LIYEPAIHVPLIIKPPTAQPRRDITSLTNNIDLLPTLLKMTGTPIPAWCEGEILPGFGGVENNDRSIYSLDAKDSPANSRLSTITIALRRGDYKLIYYTGYTAYRGYPTDLSYNKGVFELYDLAADPEESENIIDDAYSVSRMLQDQLLDAYHAHGSLPS
jgi:arylsulfatase A-like enzyme